MPRKTRELEANLRPVIGRLAERLAEELRHPRENGQPAIDEEEFPSGKVRVTVLWDEWQHVTLEERTAAILRAYDLAQDDIRPRIALASGLTLPEAYVAGMLPFRITPHLRRGDVVTQEQCRQAMVGEGASTLLVSMDTPLLAFARRDEAEAALTRLARRLPGSDQAWVITEDVLGRIEDAVER